MAKMEQTGGIANGRIQKQNINDPAINVRWALNLHDTSSNRVAPGINIEWHGSYMQRKSTPNAEIMIVFIGINYIAN